ncbi:MAG TPA: CHAT domain-containing protein [Pyrinomonadaceae bacterium]|jgi:CHAT domain-containing protein
MSESLKSEQTIRDYLLGRVADEATLEGIEELLFTDEEFSARVALAEDGIVNDYVLGDLDEADAASFRATLSGDPDRCFNVELARGLKNKSRARDAGAASAAKEAAPSLFDSLKAFFGQRGYAAASALLLVAALASAIYFTRKPEADSLAELRAFYAQERPTETRISGFGYAPLAQLRGAPDQREKGARRLVGSRLMEAAERSPSAENYHALGLYYLTGGEYADAVEEFERALRLADKGAKIHNDLGAAYFERAMSSAKEKRLEDLSRALEEFTKATELDGDLLEALFNRSLALQELAMPREAKQSWTLYLQKDQSSPWAEEARRNLSRIDDRQTQFKSDEQVLGDFLTAYRSRDDARARRIHDETKGLLREPSVPLQLSRRYLLAMRRGDEAEAAESLDALTYVGRFEREQSSEQFFSELARFYAGVGADKTERLLQAKGLLDSGQRFVEDDDYARAIAEFEKGRELFARLGDDCEAAVAEVWAAQFLPGVARVAEGRRRLSALVSLSDSRDFKILAPAAYYWLAVSDYSRSGLSETDKNYKTALRLAEAGGNAFEVQHARDGLALYYSTLGELEPALAYASRMLAGADLYYQSRRQFWRDKGTLAELTLKLKLFSTSLSFSREALGIARELPRTGIRVNQNLLNMVNAAAAKKDFAAALGYAEESKRIALSRGDDAGSRSTTADVYLLLADVKSQMKDCGEALADYDKALELYRRLPEVTARLYRIHKGRLFCFEQLDRQDDFLSELAAVLGLSEQYRTTIRKDSSRQAFFANEQGVFDAAAANAMTRRDSRGAFAFVEASRARSLLDFVESGQPIAKAEESFASVARPLSLPEIQSRLPEQVQLLQYAVLPDRLAIWIVSRARFDLVEKPLAADELEKKIDAYHSSVVGKEPEAGVRQAARELYEILIPPDLDRGKEVCVVPDKSLHQLAFASLVSPSGKYLLEDFTLFYAPSASVLVLATEEARRKERGGEESLLSVGNPDFDREENPGLPDLRAAEVEASSIAGDYHGARVLLGGEATKEAFLRDFADAEVIHFAGHFVANRRSPGNSKLLFAGGGLRSSELGARRLPRAKLAVLSACQTGFERYDKSEGAIGVARTFLALGAPVVVASQWKVDSETTKDLMIAFHDNRTRKRLPSAESLRRAQLEVLGRAETKQPFYWAAFSLFGGYANY